MVFKILFCHFRGFGSRTGHRECHKRTQREKCCPKMVSKWFLWFGWFWARIGPRECRKRIQREKSCPKMVSKPSHVNLWAVSWFFEILFGRFRGFGSRTGPRDHHHQIRLPPSIFSAGLSSKTATREACFGPIYFSDATPNLRPPNLSP